MFKIVNKQVLSRNIKRLDIESPLIARNVKPGQFVVVIPRQNSERIPLSVMESDTRRGIFTLLFQEWCEAASQLGAIPIGEEIYSMVGPLGKPTEVRKTGLMICAATGTGTAQILAICRAAKILGNKVIGVLGAKTRTELLLEPQMRLSCHKLYIATNDGSFERRGLVTTVVRELLDREPVSLVYAIGSLSMMRDISAMTKAKSIKYLIQTNTHMLCGVGMCASCRVRVSGKILLACQHGPEFDGHQVDYEFLKMRMAAYKTQEESVPSAPRAMDTPSANLLNFLKGFIVSRQD